ncbi:MAG: heavy metal-responsive transcriptional regulator [Terriglobales bacterium]
MRIGELAKRSGITVQAIRFYERERLLPKPARTDSGYRIYHPTHLERLHFIQRAKALGFSLAEIGRVLELRDNDKAPCSEVIEIAKSHLRQVDTELARLKAYRSRLSRALHSWTTGFECASGSAVCSLIEGAEKKSKRDT